MFSDFNASKWLLKGLKMSSHKFKAISSSRSFNVTAASKSLYPGGDIIFRSSKLNFFLAWFLSCGCCECWVYFEFRPKIIFPSISICSVMWSFSVVSLCSDASFGGIFTMPLSTKASDFFRRWSPFLARYDGYFSGLITVFFSFEQFVKKTGHVSAGWSEKSVPWWNLYRNLYLYS